MKLNEAAKATLREAGVSQAAWARAHWTDGRWHGDACGCPDDRCIGFHHGEFAECGCLLALLEDYAPPDDLPDSALLPAADYIRDVAAELDKRERP